ncbi:MAG: glycosyltransferase family 2 protein [cyanobacterium endosymbiont of Rhopalodia musculus]|uniref:glycosyltransferase family 2 protein n=1 Tax=cyanobacterium endosymbiont of Epithemia clementina EcSB TaxID=3034674 RepID=UPI00247FF916|nr:glycosyltransferase family 2 protein [cyanobacterium endosymbiont of Epithemia clementina EcSB]WGT67080.1 glycosyltransferase family 2 protein [cyanobacterium endosymbiont of Epithemia clementina EcSB]
MLDHRIKSPKLPLTHHKIAVLIPCRNEELTIAQVVKQFRQELPEATIYVYDNRSTDDTIARAHAAKAIIRCEPQPGKGNVIRRMFADVEADIYVLVDGDNTYEVSAIGGLIEQLITNRLDMIVGARRSTIEDKEAYRLGHREGNLFLTGVVKLLFGAQLKDMLSGYRVFSRRFVKSFPALSSGFEIETEFTVHALELKIPFAEEYTLYGSRPPGSESKLKTFTDGWRVLATAILLFKEARPFLFFGLVFIVLALISILLGLPIFGEYLATGLVPRFPTAILATSMMLLAFLSLTCGMILDSVARGRREVKRMAYLSHSLLELD